MGAFMFNNIFVLLKIDCFYSCFNAQSIALNYCLVNNEPTLKTGTAKDGMKERGTQIMNKLILLTICYSRHEVSSCIDTILSFAMWLTKESF